MVRNLKVVNTEKNDTENEFSVSLCLQSEGSVITALFLILF